MFIVGLVTGFLAGLLVASVLAGLLMLGAVAMGIASGLDW